MHHELLMEKAHSATTNPSAGARQDGWTRVSKVYPREEEEPRNLVPENVILDWFGTFTPSHGVHPPKLWASWGSYRFSLHFGMVTMVTFAPQLLTFLSTELARQDMWRQILSLPPWDPPLGQTTSCDRSSQREMKQDEGHEPSHIESSY